MSSISMKVMIMATTTYDMRSSAKPAGEGLSFFRRFFSGVGVYADAFSDSVRMTQLIEAGMPMEKAYELVYGKKLPPR